jgi:hypothetical protein
VGGVRLIMIEGMIGSGKTMTATRVGDWLARRGESVRVFCEGAADHPIRTGAEDRLRAAAGLRVPGPGVRARGTRAALGGTRLFSGGGWPGVAGAAGRRLS